MGRLLASFFLCLVLATGAKANCYVLQNNTDHEQKWGFSYNTSVGPGQLTALKMAPHDHYPSDGKWCWDNTPWKAAVRVVSGSYRRSWSGAFTMGDGSDVSPSGTYTLEPIADAPSSTPSSPQATAVSARTQKAAFTGSTPSISCVNEICDVLFQDGHVAYTDTGQPTVDKVVTIAGFKGPGSISCTPRLKSPGELCVVIDSTGQTWKGSMRPGEGAWTQWTKPPQN